MKHDVPFLKKISWNFCLMTKILYPDGR